MFDKSSRYYNLETATYEAGGTTGESRLVRYKRRRFIPAPGDPAATIGHIVVEGDRPDMIAARYAGDPLLFWRVADANLARRPRELTDYPGVSIKIPLL